MKFGLTQDQYSFIKKNVVLVLEEENAEVFVFGSRAKDTYTKFSDLDLMVRVNKVTPKLKTLLSSIKEFLDDSNFPFNVELVIEEEIAQSYRMDIINSIKSY